ncbi:hypothetical protein Sango_2516900 [Sesamum angolense]|uniref:Uncharacterized protein n=1 Tax=Sesamum angolense TaxID=2727404 RepID=A0AAE2BIC3_9LAMI|nr:hypothetical protein Sango_2516900 [Sesamum angolense]
MANARIARFITEVAPPQFVSVMRHRTSKMLDTIHEEEKESGTIDSISLSPYTKLPSSSHNPSISSLNTTQTTQLLKKVQEHAEFVTMTQLSETVSKLAIRAFTGTNLTALHSYRILQETSILKEHVN